MKKIENKNPNELTVHALAKAMPQWSKDDARYIALVEDIRERGIDQPLLIDADEKILVGVERWKVAKQLQIKEVPILVCSGDPATVILQALIKRKHYTKGALAYVAYPLLKTAHTEAVKRRLEILKNANKSSSSAQWTMGKTIEDFANENGFGRSLFFQAAELHKLFKKSDEECAEWEAKHPKVDPALRTEGPINLRSHFEQKLLDGEIGLGAVLAGIAGLTSTRGKAKPNYGQLELFSEAFETLEKRFKYWNGFDERAKNEASPVIRRVVREMPADLRKEFAKALKEADRPEMIRE